MIAKFILAALLAFPAAAAAAQFHVPLHLPPHSCGPAADGCGGFLIGGGWAGTVAKGIDLDGPGGFWELEGFGRKALGVSVRGYGFGLKGRTDPLSIGNRSGGAMAGGLEASLLLAPSPGGARYYAGFLAGVSSMDIRAPLAFTVSGGKVRVEPDSAFSLLAGFPAGVIAPLWRSDRWAADLQADAVVYAAGVTYFGYTGLAAPLYGRTRAIDPHYGCGARVGVEYRPLRLRAEAAARASSGSGNNEPLSFVYGLLSLELF